MTSRSERRAQPRLSLPLRLSWEWADPDGGLAVEARVERTWNVGAGGLYYVTRPDLVPATSVVDFVLDAPPNASAQNFLAFHLQGRGEIVRVAQDPRLSGDLVGVAIRFARPLELRTLTGAEVARPAQSREK
ncbi:MAG: hypothetical protein RL885_32640 [Planctomycetota bacterium]